MDCKAKVGTEDPRGVCLADFTLLVRTSEAMEHRGLTSAVSSRRKLRIEMESRALPEHPNCHMLTENAVGGQ